MYPWWSLFLLQCHVAAGDVDKVHITSNANFGTFSLLSVPHKMWSYTFSPQSDGTITQCVIFVLLILFSSLWILRSFGRVLWLRCMKNPALQNPQESKRRSVCFSVTVLSSDALDKHKAYSNFDSDGESVLVDNCANTYVWNERSQFANLRPIPKSDQCVSTIGGVHILLNALGTSSRHGKMTRVLFFVIPFMMSFSFQTLLFAF